MINTPKLLQNIIKVIPAPVAILDKNLVFVGLSDQWLKIYNCGGNSPLGKSLFEVFPENSGETGIRFNTVEDGQRLGHSHPEWNIETWIDDDGSSIGGLLLYRKPERGLAVSADEPFDLNSAAVDQSNTLAVEFERQFKDAFENSLVGLAVISPLGRWEKANKSLCSMLGYTEDELISMRMHELTHPDDLEFSVSALNDLVEGNIESIKIEKRYIHKNGSTVWVVIVTSMLKSPQGAPLHYIAQIENITSRKEVENDLVLSEKKYRTIFENVQDVFYQTSAEGLVTDISPSIKQYSGYSREEVIGKPVSEFYFYKQDRKRIQETLLSKGSVIDFEVRLKTHNNKLKYASVNARLVVENGMVIGAEGSMRDVTTRKFHENALKELNSQLTASNDQKNKLLSIIGHDLRNPISGSLQLLDLTLMDYESTTATELHSYLSKMKSELSNANELLEDLLSWAKTQFNAVNFNPILISDISSHINKCAHNILPMAINKGIEINQYIEDDLKVTIDTGMLETIVRNLISNAVKFSDRGGKIDVRVASDDKGIKFSVSDNGIGIPKESLDKLFDTKFNFTTYGTQGEKGTGLGLNLCYEFVHKHGGKIWAESKAGSGSTFYFTIPRM